MGPSGAGKTTVMRLITGQLKPERGEVWVGDTRVDQLGGAALNRLRRQISAYCSRTAPCLLT
jgi:phospholipid/cholesterol/gamma-HCH transport system ATP-binding protein